MHDISNASRRNALPPNRRNSLPGTVRTSRQRLCNQRVGCLPCSMAMIYGMSVWTSAPRCVGQVPCCGQDGYRAQVLQHPIYTYLKHIDSSNKSFIRHYFINLTYNFLISRFVGLYKQCSKYSKYNINLQKNFEDLHQFIILYLKFPDF